MKKLKQLVAAFLSISTLFSLSTFALAEFDTSKEYTYDLRIESENGETLKEVNPGENVYLSLYFYKTSAKDEEISLGGSKGNSLYYYFDIPYGLLANESDYKGAEDIDFVIGEEYAASVGDPGSTTIYDLSEDKLFSIGSVLSDYLNSNKVVYSYNKPVIRYKLSISDKATGSYEIPFEEQPTFASSSPQFVVKKGTANIEPAVVTIAKAKDPTITLDPSPLTFKYGETKTITATTTNFDGTVAWEVIEGSDVISIDQNNTTCGVKALKVGKAKIQASAGKAKETVEVEVTPAVKDDTIVLPSEKNVKILDIKLVNATNHGQHIFISKNGADEKQSEKTIGEILRGEWIDGTSVEGSIAIGVITDNVADVFTFDFK